MDLRIPSPTELRKRLERLYGRLSGQDEREFRARYFAEEPIDLSPERVLDARTLPNAGPFPWLDHPDALRQIDERQKAGRITGAEAALCRTFAVEGYAIIPGAVDGATLDNVWSKYQQAISAGKIHPSPEKKTPNDPHPGHVMNAHTVVPEIYEAFAHPSVMRAVELFLGRPMVPFQTLMFPKGREQLAHSDSIHMTTYPLGYMCASWIAFEDIHPDAGALFYYPRSHRLPYVFARDVGISQLDFRAREYQLVAEKYEPYIQRVLDSSGLQRKTFLAKKGDVLIWHANLVHGGSPRTDLVPSRRSMACHYFARGAFCYHDLSGKRADRVDAPAQA